MGSGEARGGGTQTMRKEKYLYIQIVIGDRNNHSALVSQPCGRKFTHNDPTHAQQGLALCLFWQGVEHEKKHNSSEGQLVRPSAGYCYRKSAKN